MPVVWAAAFVVLLGASGVATFAGATTIAALGVLSALVCDASFSAALSHTAGLVMAVGLVWLAAGAAFDDRAAALHPSGRVQCPGGAAALGDGRLV